MGGQWGQEDIWDQVDLWEVIWMDQWDMVWVPMVQWDLMDQWGQMVRWGQMDLWTWDLMDQWEDMDLWDIWVLQWAWDQCLQCLDQCQCPPCPICQCLLWEDLWGQDQDLDQWDQATCQCLDQVDQCHQYPQQE